MGQALGTYPRQLIRVSVVFCAQLPPNLAHVAGGSHHLAQPMRRVHHAGYRLVARESRPKFGRWPSGVSGEGYNVRPSLCWTLKTGRWSVWFFSFRPAIPEA